ncbi:MAG: DNA polymerase III subunit gamma/tau [Mariniblastus sp.]
MNSQSSPAENGQEYKVVALRYRPQAFGDLVGQGHIATALSNAINQNRVGHAYLFTGARGVGKTSSARIFAKCLNCERNNRSDAPQDSPTIEPCNECDICQAVSTGEDVDVLEIDGASNRGIDEIRQLRSNAAVRPSRSRFKIYIIDEVHMLTQQAFNALLKTLEEPPGHVKFIFCTTDPQKIPITVLSRCQRFDFSPVQTDKIADRLRDIATSEGVTADEQALALLARRANGSMRDSQSLLEQLFSFCGENISVDEVHQLLGTADMSRIAEVATAMTNCDPKETLDLIHRGMSEGVDAGQMADQLLGYFRDMMAARVGCGEDVMLNCTSTDMAHLQKLSETLGLETILSIVQLLDAAVVRMQSSLHSRTLLESVAIRICNLEKLDSISDLVNSLSKSPSGKSPARPMPTRSRERVEMQQVVYPKKDEAKKNDLSKPQVDSPNESEAIASAAAATAAAVAATVASTMQQETNSSAAADDVAATARVESNKPESVATESVAAEPVSTESVPETESEPIDESQADSEAQLSSESQSSGKPETETQTESTQVEPADAEPAATVPIETELPIEVPPIEVSPTEVSSTAQMDADPDSEAVSDNNVASISLPTGEVSQANVETYWKQLLDDMGDMTADMASDYEKLVLKDGLLVVTLPDSVSKDLCSKPERKQKFEAAMERLTGSKLRVDFLASKRSLQQEKVAPKLTRVQQIRKLQEDGFIKQTISLFDAEITGYRDPLPTKKR